MFGGFLHYDVRLTCPIQYDRCSIDNNNNEEGNLGRQLGDTENPEQEDLRKTHIEDRIRSLDRDRIGQNHANINGDGKERAHLTQNIYLPLSDGYLHLVEFVVVLQFIEDYVPLIQ